MNDPKVVIRNLSKRWLAAYGETLGTEEIRRHMSRILNEIQKREIEQVFANWSGEELLAAIDATFDLDDGNGIVSISETTAQPTITEASNEPLVVADPEYMPYDETVISEAPQAQPKPRGRPPGAKNKARR